MGHETIVDRKSLLDRPAFDRVRPTILSISCVYPNPAEPGSGIFVEHRLRHLAKIVDLKVVAPFALAKYGNPKGKRNRVGNRSCPLFRQDGGVSVVHSRWFYPPFSGSLAAFWLFFWLIYPLVRIRREFPFQILDTHFGHPDGVAGALLSPVFGVPFTMTLRGNEPKHSRDGLGRLWMRWALRRASRVFAVSEGLRRFAIESGAPPERVKTIPNGVDANVFFPRDRVACRARHGLATGRKLIVSAGALVERKGHHRVIEAVSNMRAAGWEVELAIAGGPGPEGQFEAQLRERVARHGIEESVRFLGYVETPALAELMAAADVFCLASSNEGWPNVVHEALACGTPVVATNVGAVPEMIASGQRGFIVPVNDPPALQQALEKALGTHWDRDAIASWGRSRSWEQVALEVLEEMQGIIAEERKWKRRQ